MQAPGSRISGAPLKGRLLASPTNIRLGWKFLPRTNTLAYNGNPQIKVVESFIAQTPSPSRITRASPTQLKHLSRAPLYGRLLASPTNIRLGWRGVPRTNTLAYYGKP